MIYEIHFGRENKDFESADFMSKQNNGKQGFFTFVNSKECVFTIYSHLL